MLRKECSTLAEITYSMQAVYPEEENSDGGLCIVPISRDGDSNLDGVRSQSHSTPVGHHPSRNGLYYDPLPGLRTFDRVLDMVHRDRCSARFVCYPQMQHVILCQSEPFSLPCTIPYILSVKDQAPSTTTYNLLFAGTNSSTLAN